MEKVVINIYDEFQDVENVYYLLNSTCERSLGKGKSGGFTPSTPTVIFNAKTVPAMTFQEVKEKFKNKGVPTGLFLAWRSNLLNGKLEAEDSEDPSERLVYGSYLNDKGELFTDFDSPGLAANEKATLNGVRNNFRVLKEDALY